MRRPRRNHAAAFKAKVAVTALRGDKTLIQIVKDLATTTIGAVVSPEAVLLNLVPQDEPLVVDVRIKNEDVSFVPPGQPVKIKLAAYPFQKHGMLEGVVERIGADTTEVKAGQDTSAAAPSYRAVVRLARQKLMSPPNEALTLTSGMLVSAEIIQRNRSILEYLLSPVQPQLNK